MHLNMLTCFETDNSFWMETNQGRLVACDQFESIVGVRSKFGFVAGLRIRRTVGLPAVRFRIL